MAMTIFLLLNAMGVVFLLYVLANFWKEGHRPKKAVRQYRSDFMRSDWPEVLAVTRPISGRARGGLSVIPLRVPDRDAQGKLEHLRPVGTLVEISQGRYSVR